jgi:hypothetical protein
MLPLAGSLGCGEAGGIAFSGDGFVRRAEMPAPCSSPRRPLRAPPGRTIVHSATVRFIERPTPSGADLFRDRLVEKPDCHAAHLILGPR